MAHSTRPSVHNSTNNLTADRIRAGIARIKSRIEELDCFDPSVMTEECPPELEALSTAIIRALEQIFGEGTSDFNRFVDAGDLQYKRYAFFPDGPSTPLSEIKSEVADNIARSRSILASAVQVLEQDLKEAGDMHVSVLSTRAFVESHSRKIFVVHGHDEGPRESVARFLERIGFQVVILHEQTNQGRTIIEKIEAHADVGFAVVLLTPDDQGGPSDGQQLPRARQNVIWEWGYFIAKLGRHMVCTSRLGETEIPSDILGVAWTPFDSHGAWKTALAKELAAAGFDIEASKVM